MVYDMNKTLLGGAIASLALAVLVPATAYHIDPTITTGAGSSIASDWVVNTSQVNLCESVGPTDDLNDNPTSLSAQGGPCYSGENDATGTWPPNQSPTTRASAPAAGSYVRFDICTATTSARELAASLSGFPYAGGAKIPTCTAALKSQSDFFFTGRIGAFQCDIPAGNAPIPTGFPSTLTGDFGLYYDRLYGFWSYDLGDGWYTEGDFANTVHTGDGTTATTSNNPGGSDNEDAFHGHVAAFIDASKSNQAVLTGGTATGSSTVEPYTGGLTLSATPGGGAGGMANNCGSSPPCPPTALASTCTTPYGPVFRAP